MYKYFRNSDRSIAVHYFGLSSTNITQSTATPPPYYIPLSTGAVVWPSSPQARVGRREVTGLEVHGRRPGRALARRRFLGDGRHRLAVPERRTGDGGVGRGAGRGG